MIVIVSRMLNSLAMCFFALITGLSMFPGSSDSLDYMAALNLTGATCFFLASITSYHRAGIDYMIAFFFLFLVAIPAQVQIAENTFPFYAALSAHYMWLAFGLLGLTQFCYLVGVSVGIRSKIGSIDRRCEDPWTRYSLWAWIFVILAIILAGASGPSNLFRARFSTEVDSSTGMGMQFLFISRSLSLLAVAMLLQLIRTGKQKRLKFWNRTVLFSFLPIFLIINYPPSLPRFILFGIVIALTCPYLDYSKPRIKLIATFASVLTLFTVLPVAKSIASGGFFDAIAKIGQTKISPYLLRVDFDVFMWTSETIRYMETGGDFIWGRNFLGVILFFIPRSLWPEKPVGTGIMVSESLGYAYTNVSSPLFAEALVAFGVSGVIVTLLALGYITSRVEARVRTGTQESRLSNFFLYVIMMGFIIIILRGSLNSVAPMFGSAFIAHFLMQTVGLRRITVERQIPL